MIHKDLKVWRDAMDLVKEVYNLTAAFPREEQFGLTNQMRRCSVSIPSNIAEGAARKGNKEFIRFLYIALGSCMELDTQLRLSKELGLIPNTDFENITSKVEPVGKMLNGLIKSLKDKQN